ncbi:hypothetical protein BH09PAT1_BH09PAT1_1700 [soil metagenome]
MRIIIDTSTILAHLFSRGENHTTEIFNLVKQKKVTLITCKEALQELKTTLASDKIKKLPYYRPHINAEFVAWYQYNAELQFISSVEPTHARDQNDSFFIHLAEISNADFLISGDKDLLVLKSINTTKVVKPKEFIISIQKIIR